MNGWFRWWHGTVSDPKLGAIASAKDSPCSIPDVIAVWCVLLETASQDVTRGNVTGVTCNEVAFLLRIDETTVRYIIDAMTARGMIIDGKLAAWDARQPAREDAVNTGSKPVSVRVREFRERKKLASQKNIDNGADDVTNVTQGNADETQSNDQIREEKIRKESTQSAKSPTKSHPGFAEFWVAYPKKVAKPDAERAWQKQQPDIEAAIAAVTTQSKSKQWRDGKQFIPHPATWLNSRRWEDEHVPDEDQSTTYEKPTWAKGAI